MLSTLSCTFHLFVFFGEISTQVLWPFIFNWYFLLLSYEFLINFGYKFFIGYMAWKYLPPLHFVFLLPCRSFLVWYTFYLLIFSLLLLVLLVSYKEKNHCQDCQGCFSLFSSRSVMISSLKCMSLICFDLIFVNGVR